MKFKNTALTMAYKYPLRWRKTLYLIFFLIAGVVYANLTNPYSKLGTTGSVYDFSIDSTGQLVLIENKEPSFLELPAYLDYISLQSFQAFFRILADSWFYIEEPFTGNAEEIITQIHRKRFDTTKPYIISGHHFSEMYTRNLGIFYNAALDPRFALSEEDWGNRQKTIISTLALHLAILKQANREYTTLYPVWGNIYSGVDIYAEPSDTLFSILYTLHAMTDSDFIASLFPTERNSQARILQTKLIGKKLIDEYGSLLQDKVNHYLERIIDPKTGLIRENILLSGARDQIKRKNSFYDNVIAWGTSKLAADLDLEIFCPYLQNQKKTCDFSEWKQNIIESFWDNDTGIFIDDLSPESRTHKLFSADSMIVLSTGFLDLEDNTDRQMLVRIYEYIVSQGLDDPLPLRYAVSDQHKRLYPVVRMCATSYMGETHWSHWGMEYIKGLIMLSSYDAGYIQIARKALMKYTQKIEKYGGYPELYDTDGIPYETWCYKSMLHTGWVVNYEQARMMLNHARAGSRSL